MKESGQFSPAEHNAEDTSGHGHFTDADRVLMEMRSLLGMTAPKQWDRSPINALIAMTPQEENALSAVTQLIGEAREHVYVVLPERSTCSNEMQCALRALLGNLDKRVKIRVLCAKNFCGCHAHWPEFESRFIGIALQAVLIVDGRAALTGWHVQESTRTSLIRDEGFVRTLQEFFHTVWEQAGQRDHHIDLGDQDRTDLARQIIKRLQAGITDEAAARELSISLRTFRRHVSHITKLLGAKSRFQAGFLAAKVGLVSVSSPNQAVRGNLPEHASRCACVGEDTC